MAVQFETCFVHQHLTGCVVQFKLCSDHQKVTGSRGLDWDSSPVWITWTGFAKFTMHLLRASSRRHSPNKERKIALQKGDAGMNRNPCKCKGSTERLIGKRWVLWALRMCVRGEQTLIFHYKTTEISYCGQLTKLLTIYTAEHLKTQRILVVFDLMLCIF